MSKYDKASLVHIPSGYKSGTLYNVLPNDADGDFDFFRGSTATRVDKNGLIETIATGTPRLDYPLLDGVVQDNPTLLLEPQATNVIINSNIFTPNTSVVVDTNNTISPDGTLNAVKVTANSGTSLKLVNTNGASSNTYRFSVFAKKNTHNIIQLGGGGITEHANFNLETGEYSSNGSMDYYGNGWYRCTVQFSAGTPLSHYISFSDSLSAARLSTSVSDGSFYLFGMQSETTSYTTSYIPTSGATVTRSAEGANGAEADFNDSEGVLYANIADIYDSATSRVISISDGTLNNRVFFKFYTVSNGIEATLVSSSGGSNPQVTAVTSDTSNYNKIALRYSINGFNLWVNGFELGSDTVTNTANNLSDISFDTASLNDFYGKAKEIGYYDAVLTDAELEALTSYTSFTNMANELNLTIK